MIRRNKTHWVCRAYTICCAREVSPGWHSVTPATIQQTDRLLAQFEAAVRPEHALVYLHFGALDWLGHEHGPGSRQVLSALRGIDHAVERVLATLDEMHGSAAALIFGDHGMVAVERTVDVQAAFAQTGPLRARRLCILPKIPPASDSGRHTTRQSQCCVGHSTVSKGSARFKKVNAKNLVSPMPILHPMGRIMYAADRGVLICPNFFQTEAIQGLHGYLPDVTDNWSRYIAHSVAWLPGHATLAMQDLFPLIVRALGLEAQMEATRETEVKVQTAAQVLLTGRLPQPRVGVISSPETINAVVAPETAPTVSLIIPTYNRARLLPRLAEALAAQS